MASVILIDRLRRFRDTFDPVVRWLAAIRLVGALGYSLSMPFLALYLHEELGITMTHIGIMMTSSGLLGAIGSMTGGILSDKWGRKQIMVRLMFVRGFIFIVLAAVVFFRQPFLLFASIYLLNGFIGMAIFPIMDAVVADVTSHQNRREAYGMLRVASNLGWSTGPAIGGVMMVFGYHWLFLSTACVVFTIATLASIKLRETRILSVQPVKSPYNLTALKDNFFFVKFLLICMLFYFVHGQLIAPLSVHASSVVGLSKIQIGMLYFINAGMVTVLQFPITRLIRNMSALPALSFACILYALGYYWIGYAGSMMVMASAVAIFTFGEMIEAPVANAYVSYLAPAGMTGAYMGAFNLVVHLGWSVGPLIGGLLQDNISNPVHTWTVISSMAAVAAIGFALLNRSSNSVKLSETKL